MNKYPAKCEQSMLQFKITKTLAICILNHEHISELCAANHPFVLSSNFKTKIPINISYYHTIDINKKKREKDRTVFNIWVV